MFTFISDFICAAIAQMGERQTEDLKVLGSIPSGGSSFSSCQFEFFLDNIKLPKSLSLQCIFLVG